ncbi:VOC family protein [Antrihabitans spumae]|uniref:VOC family protein n=1 Tax=Antrihabitans spumae TaxID=3373370 RepID=A0ABW7K4C2_9NOCA
MSPVVSAISFDCRDWPVLVAFWSELLGYAEHPLNSPGGSAGGIVGPAGTTEIVFVEVARRSKAAFIWT